MFPGRLFSNLEKYSSNTAFIDTADRKTSYQDLIDIATEQISKIEISHCLIGIEAGQNALLPLATYVGAMRAGHSVVLVPTDGLASDSRIYETFKPAYVFRASSEGWEMERHFDPDQHILHEDLAVMLPTSGSTGAPKLVKLSHQNLLSNAHSICTYLDLSMHDRACMTLPWTYAYGLSVINSHLLSGATILLCDNAVSEPSFWEFFKRHQASSFSGVPHTYELLEKVGFLDQEYPSLRYFTQAGGKLSPEKVSLFADYAERHKKLFYVMYGQTEASPRIAYMPPDKLKKFPNCIGQAIPGGHLTLIDANENEIQELNQRGELLYTGPNVMMGYATDIEALQKGPEVTALHTGDIAIRNHEGLFEIVGRSSRISKIIGFRIALDDVENVLKQAGITAAVAGDDVGIVVATTDIGQSARIANIFAGRFKLPRSSLQVVELQEMPRLSSNKLDYPAILRLGREQANARHPSARRRPLRQEIMEILHIIKCDDEESFVSLGGDSLSYIQVASVLEHRIGRCPKGWASMPIRQLEELEPSRPLRQEIMEIPDIKKCDDEESFVSLGGGWASMPIRQLEELEPSRPSWFQWADTDVFIRAVAIFLIVVHHVTQLKMPESAFSLLIVAGYNFSRFQFQRLSRDSSLKILKPMLSNIVPLYLTVITLFFLYERSFFLPQYLFVSTFTRGFYLNGVRVLTTWWFIEVYVWLLILFSIIFKFRYVRDLSLRCPWNLSFALLIVCMAARGSREWFANVNLFYPNSPLMLSPFFAMGLCIFMSNTLIQRLLSTGIILSFLYLFGFRTEYILLSSILLLTWIHAIPLDRWTNRILTSIAHASFYIYITHGIVISLVSAGLGGPIRPSLFPVIIPCCILLGIVTSHWLTRSQRSLFEQLSLIVLSVAEYLRPKRAKRTIRVTSETSDPT